MPSVIPIALSLCLGVTAPADRATVVVDVGGETWFADALAGVIERELARFSRVRLVDKIAAGAACPTRAFRCLAELYKSRGVDIVVLGALKDGVLDYELHETWSPSRAARGSVPISGINAARLDQRMGDMVRPITGSGGLLDLRPTDDGLEIHIPPVAVPIGWIFGLILIMAAMLSVPVLLLRLLVNATDLKRQQRPMSWVWSPIIIGSLFFVVTLSQLDWGPLEVQLQLRGLSAVPTLLLPLIGGVLWGALALIVFRFVFSPIAGLSNVRQNALWPVLVAWFSLAAFRAVALLPLVFLLWSISLIEHRITWVLLIPGAGLMVWFWLMALSDNLTTFLDMRLVVGPASERNAWHAHLRRYFVGCVHRSGISLDPAVLRNALFLPGVLPGVHVYGGGFARPRIIVGEHSRELALGEIPDDRAAPDRTVNLEELPYGLLWPSPIAGRDRRFDDRLEAKRRELNRGGERGQGSMPKLLGENATVLGWVMPRHDLAPPPLAQKGGGEHIGAFEKFLTYDEHDDSDPSHKDFLAGALVGAVGELSRGNAPWNTLRLAMPWLPRFFASPATRVSDAYVALNHTLHPLIQYLHQVSGGDPSWLTARANGPALLATSERILDKGGNPRVAWLAHFFRATPARTRRMRFAIVAAGSLLIAGAFAFVLAREAIDYHQTYVERMAALRAQANGDEHVRTKD